MGIEAAGSYDKKLSREARKAGGVFYTPDYVIRYMVERTVGEALKRCRSIDDVLGLRICDPACGAGGFLRSAQEHIVRWALAQGLCADSIRRVELESGIQRHCLFGIDIDPTAIRLAAKALPSASLHCLDALEPGALSNERFDLVLGNPPYGATNALKGDSTRHFMQLAASILKEDGRHAFIVPKAFLYSSAWTDLLERFLPNITEIVDCGKAWREVKLEQVIYFYGAGARGATYRSSIREGEGFVSLGSIAKASAEEFGFALNGVSELELRLGRKIKATGSSFGEHVNNRRGLALQPMLSSRHQSGIAAYGGKQIGRFALDAEPKGYVPARLAESIGQGYAPADCILAQNIVAHVQSPFPHLKIAATLPGQSTVLVLDTVNRLFNRGPHSSHYLLAVLNSRLIAWYVYRFVVGKAVRTIHFDGHVTARIPLPRKPVPTLVSELARAAVKMSVAPSPELDARIDDLVFRLYGLSSSEVSCLGEGVGEGR